MLDQRQSAARRSIAPSAHCAPGVTQQATPGSTHRFRRGIMLSMGPNRMRSSLEKLRSSGWPVSQRKTPRSNRRALVQPIASEPARRFGVGPTAGPTAPRIFSLAKARALCHAHNRQPVASSGSEARKLSKHWGPPQLPLSPLGAPGRPLLVPFPRNTAAPHAAA